jgi:superoxide reductase
MVALDELTADTSLEKHVPYIEKTGAGYLVRVGENQAHPMLEAHWILWIELDTDRGTYRKFLKPGDPPRAEFIVVPGEMVTGAREYCNLHGLWKK